MKLIDYLQNEDLCSVGVKLGEHLAADQQLIDYCNEHFGKAATIIVGPPEAYMPDADDAPYIFLHDFGKNEGANQTSALYECVVTVGIATDEVDAISDAGVKIFAGQQRVSEMLTLLQDSLYRYKDSCQPPAKVEQLMPGMPGNNPQHWEGFLSATWELPLSIGEQNHF